MNGRREKRSRIGAGRDLFRRLLRKRRNKSSDMSVQVLGHCCSYRRPILKLKWPIQRTGIKSLIWLLTLNEISLSGEFLDSWVVLTLSSARGTVKRSVDKSNTPLMLVNKWHERRVNHRPSDFSSWLTRWQKSDYFGRRLEKLLLLHTPNHWILFECWCLSADAWRPSGITFYRNRPTLEYSRTRRGQIFRFMENV